MSFASLLGSPIKSRHLLLLGGAVAAAGLLAATIWKAGLLSRAKTYTGPFVEFEVRLPAGILLPADKNIELTLWTNGMGRGCRSPVVRRSVEPPEIFGKCAIMVTSHEYLLSLRLSNFYEGYWKMPIGRSANPDPLFSSWQRIEFTRAPIGERELSALPHGEYYARYLVR